MSMNEELQSANEELETSQEELLDLRIMRFSPVMQPLLHLIPADVGRPIDDISQKLISSTGSAVSLRADAETVLDTLRPLERELQASDGAWYIQRMLPYRTEKHQIKGIVVIFIDTTRLKRTHENAREAEA